MIPVFRAIVNFPLNFIRRWNSGTGGQKRPTASGTGTAGNLSHSSGRLWNRNSRQSPLRQSTEGPAGTAPKGTHSAVLGGHSVGAWRGRFWGAPQISTGRVAPHQLGVRVKRGESGHREQAGDWGGRQELCGIPFVSSVRRHGRMHRAHRAAHVTQCSGCNVKLPCFHGGAPLSRIQPTHLPGSRKFSPPSPFTSR